MAGNERMLRGGEISGIDYAVRHIHVHREPGQETDRVLLLVGL
jgi:hypothetical protein